MASDAVSLIEQDHRALEALFDKVLAGDGDRVALIEEITLMLTAHARAEEQEVYPAIKQADPDEEPEVEHAYDEHYEAEHLLRSARNLVASPHFEDAFTAFVAAVSHHVEEEETEILPALREAVDGATLNRLGEAFERRRAELLGAAPAEQPGGKVSKAAAPKATATKAAKATGGSKATGTASKAKATGDSKAANSKAGGKTTGGKAGKAASQPLEEATRDELYQLAKDADIPGRSAMTKQELVEALREGA